MKRFLLVLVMVGLVVFSYCPVLAGLSVHSVDGQIGTDTIMFGAPITINILWDQNEFPGCNTISSENGYRLYSPTGTLFTASGEWNPGVDWGQYYNGGFFVSQHTGGGEDTVRFGGFRLLGDGIPDGFYDVAHVIHLDPFPQSAIGGEICIDSSWCPPS